MLKDIIKNLIGKIKCILNGISNDGRVYIGRNVHIVNGKNLHLGSNVSIRPDCDIFADGCIKIGDNCDIGTRNRLNGDIYIEDSVLIGFDNYISSNDHCYKDINVPIMYQGAYMPNKNNHSELRIGSGSWIGTHVAIIGDVHIGKNCVIGANAVVLYDIPDYCEAVGNPAKVVKRYDFKTNKWLNIL